MTRFGRASRLSVLLFVLAGSVGESHEPETQPAVATPVPTPPPTGSLEVTLARREKEELAPAAGAVVWIEGIKAGEAATAMPTVSAREKRFSPRVVAVPVGGTVDFPNHDRFYHNVFSLSETKAFDLGLYKNGKSKSVKFEKSGVVKVYCNIHPTMTAYVIVVGGAVHGVTGDDGRVRFERLPVGSHKVHVWDEKGGEFAASVVIADGTTKQLNHTLDIAGIREDKHKNKFGEEYPSPDNDESRY